MRNTSWDRHYEREKSELTYPDENLVRLIRRFTAGRAIARALDLGCGSGRHIPLLAESGARMVVGTDASHKATLCASRYQQAYLMQCDNRRLPFKSESIDIVVAWGSLHYGTRKDLETALDEIRRVLVPDGILFATLRCERDTYLTRGAFLGDVTWRIAGGDIDGAVVSFFREEDLPTLFAGFGGWSHGLMERTPVGMRGSLVSHWILHVWK